MWSYKLRITYKVIVAKWISIKLSDAMNQQSYSKIFIEI